MLTNFTGRLCAVLMLIGWLAGCGGGGSGTGTATLLGAGKTAANATSTGTGTGTGSTSATPTLAVALASLATGAPSNTLTAGSPLRVSATVRDGAGTPVSNVVVSFSTDVALGVFTPAGGTALTNANGVATVQLDAKGLSSAGAAMVTANAEVGGSTVTASSGYSLGAANVSLSALSLGQSQLSAYGTSSASVNVSVNGSPSAAPVAVNFSSACATSGKASLPATVQSINGVATATYRDNGCAGRDTITASVQGTNASTSATITVLQPQAANVQFVSAAPGDLVLTGTGGGVEVSNVTFKVVDTTGNPVASAGVTFDLTTRAGGLTLDGQASGAVTKQTGADGTVSVSVRSGTVPTSVWVTATLQGQSISSQSNKLVVSTGRPAQDRFSLSVETFNIEGWNYDGTRSKLTVIASDRLGNPVPDGTTVNFVSEGGQVAPATCQTTGGSCNVDFVSSEYRPRNDDEPSHQVTHGRATVLAYAVGEESFSDTNQNNRHDAGEPFNDLGNAFISNAEVGNWQAGDQEIVFGAGSQPCPAYPASHYAAGGTYVSAPYKDNTCDGTWGAAHVRRSTVVVLSSSYVGTVTPSTFSMGGACTGSFLFRLADVNQNPMPAASTLSTTANTVEFMASGATKPSVASLEVVNDRVPSTSAAGGTWHAFIVRASDCIASPAGSFALKVTTPKGVVNTQLITITP